MRRTAAAIGVLVALLATAPADSQAKRAVPRGFYGAIWDGNLKYKSGATARALEWERMQSSGVEASRTSFDWSFAQPNPNGDTTFDQTDEIVSGATTQGIELLPVVTTPPWWARTGHAPFAAPRDPKEYANYLVALIGRYGPDGSFWAAHPELPKHAIRAWQVWNEPSLRAYWTPPPGGDWAAGYGKLLKVAYKAVKRADPGARVVLAGLPNTSWNALRSLYKRGKVKGNYDIAAVHPFTATRHGVVEIVRRFRKAMAAYGDGGKPLWVTELGLPASRGKANSPSPLQTNMAGMTSFLTESYAELTAARGDPATKVDRAYWYTWASSYTGDDIWRYAGLLHHAWSSKNEQFEAKPALDAYRNSALKAEGR